LSDYNVKYDLPDFILPLAPLVLTSSGIKELAENIYHLFINSTFCLASQSFLHNAMHHFQFRFCSNKTNQRKESKKADFLKLFWTPPPSFPLNPILVGAGGL